MSVDTSRIQAADAVAKRKAKIEGWEPFCYELVGSDGIRIKGAVLRVITRGPNKGCKTARGCHVTEVVVVKSEINAERARAKRKVGTE